MRAKIFILLFLLLGSVSYGQGWTEQNVGVKTTVRSNGGFTADTSLLIPIRDSVKPAWWNDAKRTYNGQVQLLPNGTPVYYFNGFHVLGSGGGGGSTSITVGTTPILSGTSTRIPFNNSGVYGESSELTWGALGVLTPTLGVGNSAPSSTGTIIVGGSGTGIGTITGGGGGLNVNGGDLNLSPDPTHFIKFTTNTIERARILNNGNIGVGATAPDSLFQISGGGFWANRGVRLSGLPTGSGVKALRIDASGVLSVSDTATGGGADSAIFATNYRVDTAKVNLRTSINTKLNISDTAIMLAPYATKSKVMADSIALAANINARVKYTDTAVMLTDYINSASNGITKTGKNVALGGALTGATTITTTGVNTLALAGLQSGTAADSVLVANATTGVIRRRATSTLGGSGWGLTGNAGTSYTTNYIGTSDNVNLAFRTNNVKSGFIEGAATGNTGFGYSAAAGTLSSFNNSAFGYNAARDLTSGQNNTILGSMAGQAITTASSCTFVGFQIARLANASGNTAVGNQSLFTLTSGINNCGLGNQSLYSLTTGASNLGIGSLACYSLGSAGFNVGIGQEALFSNTAGFYNAAVGTSALYSTTGQYNVALGHQAGYNLTSGSQCLFLGNFAGPNISNTADGQANLNNGLFGAGLTSTSAASPAGRWSIGTQTPDATALLYIAGQMKAVNYVANSAAPSAIVGPGAGATGSVSVSAAGSNHNYQVTVTVAGATATGNIAIMTMSGGFSVSTAMRPVMSPVNDAAKALSGTQQVGIDGSTTTHTIASGTVALLPGVYTWNVICLPK